MAVAQVEHLGPGVHAAQHGLHAGQQLQYLKGLHDVIVGAKAQPLQTAGKVVLRRNENDGQRRVQLFLYFKAGAARQHHIQ